MLVQNRLAVLASIKIQLKTWTNRHADFMNASFNVIVIVGNQSPKRYHLRLVSIAGLLMRLIDLLMCGFVVKNEIVSKLNAINV